MDVEVSAYLISFDFRALKSIGAPYFRVGIV